MFHKIFYKLGGMKTFFFYKMKNI